MSANIEDYYPTPHELGYGPIVTIRLQLPGGARPPARGKKVTFVWNGDDPRAMGSLFRSAPRKFIDLPLTTTPPCPSTKVEKTTPPGTLHLHCHSFSAAMLSLGCVDVALASRVRKSRSSGDAGLKPTSEPHVQTRIAPPWHRCPTARQRAQPTGLRRRGFSPASIGGTKVPPYVRCVLKNVIVRCHAVSAAVASYCTAIGMFTAVSLANACCA